MAQAIEASGLPMFLHPPLYQPSLCRYPTPKLFAAVHSPFHLWTKRFHYPDFMIGITNTPQTTRCSSSRMAREPYGLSTTGKQGKA